MSGIDSLDKRHALPAASWETLCFRASLLRRLRAFFDERQFVEVETPLLSNDSVADQYIDPIPVTYAPDPRSPNSGRRMWLQTSPEFGMKRLLAAGADRIYQVTKAFRAGEQGTRHNPEFTIVEWYRVGDTMEQGIDLLVELACEMLGHNRAERISYEEAFVRWCDLNPHTATPDELAACAHRFRLHPPERLGRDRDGWLNFLLAACVEPHLGVEAPTILYEYPASQAALASLRRRPFLGSGDSRQRPSRSDELVPVAERFELYVQGMELANGSHELLDPSMLQERNRIANAIRRADGRYPVPDESRLLDAMRHGLPDAAGTALGFDRLVMLAAGKERIEEVIPFPFDVA